MVITADNFYANNYETPEPKAGALQSSKTAVSQTLVDSYSGSQVAEEPKKVHYVSLPTKKYVDGVIKEALKNIEKGWNVEENEKIVRIFSNIIRENPSEILLKSYYG